MDKPGKPQIWIKQGSRTVSQKRVWISQIRIEIGYGSKTIKLTRVWIEQEAKPLDRDWYR